MYNLTIKACAVFLLLLSSNIAMAEGPYWGVNGGAAFLQDANNTGGGVDIESQTDTGFALGTFAGYEFGNNLRVEGELNFRRNSMDELTIVQDAGAGVALGVGDLDGLSADADGDISALSGMANVYYDFRTGSPWVPYVGAGIGVAHVMADVDILDVKVVDDADTVFAYQAMAGVSYFVQPDLVLFAGYRYFGTADPELEDEAGGAFDSEYQSHNVEVGFRYAF